MKPLGLWEFLRVYTLPRYKQQRRIALEAAFPTDRRFVVNLIYLIPILLISLMLFMTPIHKIVGLLIFLYLFFLYSTIYCLYAYIGYLHRFSADADSEPKP